MEKIKRIAFTLAEVLITLGIIGVVAAMTIPTLLSKTQDAQLKTAWKKEYSTLAQATKNIIQEEGGGTFAGLCPRWDSMCLLNYYKSYIKSSKLCSGQPAAGNPSSLGCWTSFDINTGKGITKLLNGSDTGFNNMPLGYNPAGMVLLDGAFVIVAMYDGTCKSIDYLNPNDLLPNECGFLTVDVNGAKKPNIVGKDTFSAYITSDGLVPAGTKALENTCNTSSNGIGCSAKYLIED